MDGQFAWFDLMSRDRAGAIAFYTTTMGWETESWDLGPQLYTMFKAPGEPALGGVDDAPEGAPQHWMAYVTTADCDAAAAKVVALGGAVHVPPTDIPTVGRFAVVSDPAGATFAAFTPNRDPSEPSDPTVTQLAWAELVTEDLDATFAFYAALFGWEKTGAMDMGPGMGVYQMFGHGGASLGGMMKRPPEMSANAWLYYFRTADLGATIARALGAGGALVNGPMEVPGGDHVAVLLDPQGGLFAVFQNG